VTTSEADHPTDADESAAPPTSGRRRIALIAGVVVATAVLLAVVVATGGSVSAPTVQLDLAGGGESAERAPTFVMASLTSEDAVVDLADRAGSPIVLNFWASWCVPCRREMPAFEAVHRDYAGRVAFIGVNHQDGRAEALDLLAETGVTYPTVYDPQGVIAYDYDLFGMPTTVFIDANGRIVGRHTGELTQADLRATLERILAGDR
jgi:cytochrome c biogenesis protein CcmG/thiol:disulfide interchange protein DsbE